MTRSAEPMRRGADGQKDRLELAIVFKPMDLAK